MPKQAKKDWYTQKLPISTTVGVHKYIYIYGIYIYIYIYIDQGEIGSLVRGLGMKVDLGIFCEKTRNLGIF